jgi:hypothetical protein
MYYSSSFVNSLTSETKGASSISIIGVASEQGDHRKISHAFASSRRPPSIRHLAQSEVGPTEVVPTHSPRTV